MKKMEDFLGMFTENMTENGIRRNPGVLIRKHQNGETQPVTAIGGHKVMLERKLYKEWINGKDPLVAFLCIECKLGLMCYGHIRSINIRHIKNAIIILLATKEGNKMIFTERPPMPDQIFGPSVGQCDPCHESQIKKYKYGMDNIWQKIK